jgi:hypothetical protein
MNEKFLKGTQNSKLSINLSGFEIEDIKVSLFEIYQKILTKFYKQPDYGMYF